MQNLSEKILIAPDNDDSLETLLNHALQDVDLIGQLPISEEAFGRIANVLRELHFSALRKQKVPAALFIASMVFCARYSNEESRNFWTPYADKVWRQKPTPVFQNMCREQFKKSTKQLVERFGLRFPKLTGGDVVRPLYYHALIPAHLKDDFVDWLERYLDEFIGLEYEQIRNILPETTTYIARTLKSFIENENTQDAALNLIWEMLEAVRFFQEGESPEAIGDSLNSIVEREIWTYLTPKLKSDTIHRSRHVQPKLGWVWSFSSDEMMLRLRDVRTNADQKPYQVVPTHKHALAPAH